MDCVICGNFRSGAKTLNLSPVGAQTICHILGIKEPERSRAVSNLQGCKICQECSENIKTVYLTLHQASKVSVEIDEWRLKFFQKLGSDSKPESEAKKQKLERSSLKVRNRHELTKKVRNHIRRELRIDKKAEKITSLRMLDPTKDATLSMQPMVQSSGQPTATVVPNTNYSAASDGSTLEGLEYHIENQGNEMDEFAGEVDTECEQPLQIGEDQPQQLTLGFYTEREMEEELVENAKSVNQDEANGYTLRILDQEAPLGTLEQGLKRTESVYKNEELKKIAGLFAENKRKCDGVLEQLDNGRNDLVSQINVSKKCTSPSRRKQTIKLSCYDFKRPKEASADASSTTEQMEQGPKPSTSHPKTQAPPPVRALRSSSSTSQDLQSEKSAAGTTVHKVLQGSPKHVYSSRRKGGHQVMGKPYVLPKLRFGESIAVIDGENDGIPESPIGTGNQGTKSRRGEIVDIISYKSIMNGNDDDEDDDDEDYSDDYETAYYEQGLQSSNAEGESAGSAAREALERLAALGQCDIEHITMDLHNESDFGLSAANIELSLQGYSSVALKDAPFDIINVESPNINCEESNDADGVITVEGTDRAMLKV